MRLKRQVSQCLKWSAVRLEATYVSSRRHLDFARVVDGGLAFLEVEAEKTICEALIGKQMKYEVSASESR